MISRIAATTALAILAAHLAACSPSGGPPARGFSAASLGVGVECPMINIGTPANPRYVKDPACGENR